MQSTFLKNFAFWVRVFSIFCTYISEGVFKPHFNKSREKVQTKCTIPQNGRTRQAAGAGKQPPEAAARYIWAERRVYAAVRGADADSGHGRRARATGGVGQLRRDAAAG